VGAKPRLDVHLYVTPRCNLECPHCYYDAFDRKRHPDNLISLADISALLTGLCNRFDADISLEGGEPFLRVGIDRMLAGLDADVLRTLTVTTNGTIRMQARSSVLRSLGQLRVSLDGHLDELQRELRGIDTAPVVEICRQLQESSVPFWIRTTLWRRNIRSLAQIYDWVEEHDVRQLSLFEFQSSGRGIGQDLMYGVSDADVSAFLSDLAVLQRPPCLQKLLINMAERRVASVLARRRELERAGLMLRELPETPNCTINYDGTVGISPWRVTANGASDVFTTITAPDFFEIIEKAANAGALRDESGCISRIQIRGGECDEWSDDAQALSDRRHAAD
jgi:MoaA/NifB/PqqE/SkfB family radical SAM enzyme